MRHFTTRKVLLVTCLAGLAWACPAEAAKIACVGDSITFGYGLSDASTQSYPAVLQTLLGAGHTVHNFGTSGTTLLKNGDKPYWDDANYAASGNFGPDVVIVMLGTNDAKAQNWAHQSEFSGDYDALVAHYRALGALVYIAAPPPVYAPGAYDIQPDVLNDDIVPLVRQIASDLDAPLIDVYAALSGKSADFPDTVHPNADGARIIAETVNAALMSHGFGGNGTAGASSTGSTGGASSAGQGGRFSDGGRANAAGMSFGGVGGTAGSTSGVSGSGQSGRTGSGGKAGIGGTAGGARGEPATGGKGPARGGAGGAAAIAAGNPGLGGNMALAGVSAAGAAAGASGTIAAMAGGSHSLMNGSEHDSGCGCRIERNSDSRVRAALLACAALLALRARRKRWSRA